MIVESGEGVVDFGHGGTSNAVISQNKFQNANGPADSAGCHIDFNCNDVIVERNLSRNNAGGFIEILGNNNIDIEAYSDIRPKLWSVSLTYKLGKKNDIEY